MIVALLLSSIWYLLFLVTNPYTRILYFKPRLNDSIKANERDVNFSDPSS